MTTTVTVDGLELFVQCSTCEYLERSTLPGYEKDIKCDGPSLETMLFGTSMAELGNCPSYLEQDK